MEMNYREAKEDDLVAIVEMIADDKLGKTREDFKVPLPSSYSDAFHNINKDPNQELITLTEDDAKVIGTMQLSFIQYLTYQGGIRMQIEAVRIHKDFRGKGLGEHMFKWAIQRGKDRGVHVIQLTTDKKRPEAVNFYKKLGFIDSHEGMKLHL